MATCTFALDGSSYTFLGYGIHTPLYEKEQPLTHYAGAMNTTNFDALCAELSLFTWIRIQIDGGESYRETFDKVRNAPAKKQASYLARLNRIAGPFRYIVSPYSAPGSALPAGVQNTLTVPDAYVTTDQLVNDNDTVWQLWLDSCADEINKLMVNGCGVEIFTSPNEAANSFGANFWQSYISNGTTAIDWVKKIWLGTGLSGGGIHDRFPQLTFLFDDTNGNYGGNVAGDGTAGPAVTYWGKHSYTEGISDPGSSPFTGNGIVTEFGSTTSTAFASITYADLKPVVHNAHDAVTHFWGKVVCYWTSLRDISAMTFIARPCFNLTTGAGTYAVTPYFYALKPYLLANGRGNATVLKASSGSSGSDANFDPATGVYVTVMQRSSDSKWCVVYANFQGSDRTGDVLAFTVGGSAHDLSGTLTDYDVMGMSAGAPSNISTTAGSYTLGTVTNGHIQLLELS